jgi:CubicO group peptidase (beta-lactamase class C family)
MVRGETVAGLAAKLAGVDDLTLARTTAQVDAGAAAGLHTGAQLAASIDGRPIIDRVWGDAGPGVAMTATTVLPWLSATKIVTAVGVAQQWERGEFDLDERVADHIPAFAAGGKEAITIRHLLTHTGGFRTADPAVEPLKGLPWDEVIAAVCAAPLEPGWVPGRKAGYHIHAGHLMLAELVRLIDGRPFHRYAREAILQPIGATGFTLGDDGDTDVWPSSSGRGPAHDMLKVLELLQGRGERAGVRLLQPQTVDAMAAHQRVGMFDETFKIVMDWGLGFVVDTKYALGDRIQPYGYGAHASTRTFGHGGAQSSVGFVDPEYGLAVALVFNGRPGEMKHTKRQHDALTALYEDLGLS